MANKFPEVHHIFQRFMKMKYQLPKHSGEVKMCGIYIAARSLVPSRHYRYLNRDVNLAVLDVRKIPRGKKTERGGDVNWFLNMLAEKLEPKMIEPNVWLLIMETKEELEVTTAFVESALSAYDKVSSTYVSAKAERLNNVTNRSIAPNVPLLFLCKRENGFAESVRDKVLPQYKVPTDCLYYFDPARNTEAKWRISPRELRIEFYLNILEDFATIEDNILGIWAGPKYMLAAKVCLENCLSSSRQ